MPVDVDLREFENLPGVRWVADLVRKWWKLEIAFADSKGYVLSHADGKIVPSDNEFCRQALFSKEGFRRCNESVVILRDLVASQRNGGATVHPCHLGFQLVAAPIFVNDEFVGFVFAGGGVTSPISEGDEAELLSRTREFAASSPAELAGAAQAVPVLGDIELLHLRDLVELAASFVMDACGVAKKGSKDPPPVLKEAPGPFKELVGMSPTMRELYALLEKIIRSESTVLIHGESGTGKELIARAIHYSGSRKDKPFVVQNCSAFNDNLLESALFGHARGSFTGAVKDQKGLFEVADGGTFFLDEIGDMSAALQVKLLRVLQEGTFTPLGTTKPVKVDVRIIAASHKDLTAMVDKGQFREDLYYRVNVLRIQVPPLRERLEDMPALVAHFLKKHYHGEGAPPRLAADTLEAFRRYRWPGNIRELENEIERLLVIGGREPEVGSDLLSPRIAAALAQGEAAPARAPIKLERTGTLREVVESVEAEVIQQGLIRTHWNKSQLAKELGISRSNLIQKCNYYGLDRPGEKNG